VCNYFCQQRMKPALRLALSLFFLAIGCIIAPGTASAQNWWMTNSLKQDNPPSGTRFHAEGEYSFYVSTGQVSSHLHKGAPYIFIRNGRLQLSAFGSIS